MTSYYIKLNISPESNFIKIWTEIYQNSQGIIADCPIHYPKKLHMTVAHLGNINLSRKAQSSLKVAIKDIINQNKFSLEEHAYRSEVEQGNMTEYARLDISSNDGLQSLQKEIKKSVEKILKSHGVNAKIATLSPHISIAKDDNVKTKFNDLKGELDKILCNRDCTKFSFDSWSLVAGKHEEKEYIDFSDWG